jgi:hypothetical protein
LLEIHWTVEGFGCYTNLSPLSSTPSSPPTPPHFPLGGAMCLRPRCLIPNEQGYMTLSPRATHLFFQVVYRCLRSARPSWPPPIAIQEMEQDFWSDATAHDHRNRPTDRAEIFDLEEEAIAQPHGPNLKQVLGLPVPKKLVIFKGLSPFQPRARTRSISPPPGPGTFASPQKLAPLKTGDFGPFSNRRYHQLAPGNRLESRHEWECGKRT